MPLQKTEIRSAALSRTQFFFPSGHLSGNERAPWSLCSLESMSCIQGIQHVLWDPSRAGPQWPYYVIVLAGRLALSLNSAFAFVSSHHAHAGNSQSKFTKYSSSLLLSLPLLHISTQQAHWLRSTLRRYHPPAKSGCASASMTLSTTDKASDDADRSSIGASDLQPTRCRHNVTTTASEGGQM